MARRVELADRKRLAPRTVFSLLKRQRHLLGPVGPGERGAADVGVQVAGLARVARAVDERARLLDHHRAVDRHAQQHDALVGADLGEPGEVDDALLVRDVSPRDALPIRNAAERVRRGASRWRDVALISTLFSEAALARDVT